jgi:transcriptional regulator with XRE-family HTH domain
MSFKDNLKAELAYSGMLVKELAVKTGLKKHTIDNYLSSRGRMPAADAAVRIADALGVSVEYLIKGTETADSKTSAYLPPEIRQIARTAEKLSPDYRKIVMYFIETLKKHEEAKGD